VIYQKRVAVKKHPKATELQLPHQKTKRKKVAVQEIMEHVPIDYLLQHLQIIIEKMMDN